MVHALSPLLLLLAVAQPAAAPPGSGLRFAPAADEWGIDFRHGHGGEGDFFMIETMGSGVVALDHDGDGDDDLLFVDSGQPEPHGGSAGRTTLLRNDLVGAGGRFVDVTKRSGVRLDSYGMGAVAGDVDGDGDEDLYFTAFGPNRLWLNQGDGSFAAAPGKGVAEDPAWSASAALGDLDLDGDLDLYVTNYVDFDYDNNRICGERQRRSYCHPDVYNGLTDTLFRNDGGPGSVLLVDATADAGLADLSRTAGLGVAIVDLDGDDRPDIYVANDMDPNLHLVRRGRSALQFEDEALLAGTGRSESGETEAGMGVAVGDVDGNGLDDLIVTHLDRQTNALYSNTGDDGLYLDRRRSAGLAEPSLPWVGFGVALADFDLDGDLDLAVANGHVSHPTGSGSDQANGMAQPNQLFENRGGRFLEVRDHGVPAVRISRGLATADFDLDGDVDVVVSNSGGAAEAWANRSERGGRSLQIDLVDRDAPNRRAIGAVLELRSLGAVQRRVMRTGTSYLSQHSLTQTFGLAPGARADEDRSPPVSSADSGSGDQPRLDVRWPQGRRLRLTGLPTEGRLRLVR